MGMETVTVVPDLAGVMISVLVMVTDVGVMLGAHTMVIVVLISMILVLLVMDLVVETPVLAGVILLVLIMVIVAQIIGECVPTIKVNKLIEKPLKKLPKLPEGTDEINKMSDIFAFYNIV